MEQVYTEIEKNSNYIQKCGYSLVEIWECQWKQMNMQNPELQQFLRRFRRPLDYKWKMTEAQVLEAVKEDTLFGMVECDIEVPEDLKAYFAEMTPIFKNIHVAVEDIGGGICWN